MWHKISTWIGIIGIIGIISFTSVWMVYPSAITQIVGIAGRVSGTNLWVDIKSTATGELVTSEVLSGTGVFSIKRVDITTASVNLAFGLTSRKVLVVMATTNTDDVCVDWLGGTAVCPAANTAGDARLAPGTTIIMDAYAVSSLSVIAASGTQTVNITAWN